MIFVDTNYFLRYLRDDIQDQAKIVKELFLKAAEGKIKLFSSTVVFFEIFWVVDRFYKYERSEISDILNSVLALNFIYFEEKEVLNDTLDLYTETTLELEDCYNIAYARDNKAEEFLTFDRKLGNFLKKK